MSGGKSGAYVPPHLRPEFQSSPPPRSPSSRGDNDDESRPRGSGGDRGGRYQSHDQGYRQQQPRDQSRLSRYQEEDSRRPSDRSPGSYGGRDQRGDRYDREERDSRDSRDYRDTRDKRDNNRSYGGYSDYQQRGDYESRDNYRREDRRDERRDDRREDRRDDRRDERRDDRRVGDDRRGGDRDYARRDDRGDDRRTGDYYYRREDRGRGYEDRGDRGERTDRGYDRGDRNDRRGDSSYSQGDRYYDRGDRGGYGRRDQSGHYDSRDRGDGRDRFGGQQRRRGELRDGEIIFRLEDVAQKYYGLIRGKKGATVQKLNERHNVEVIIPKEGEEGVIRVQGMPDNVKRCANAIYGMLPHRPCSHAATKHPCPLERCKYEHDGVTLRDGEEAKMVLNGWLIARLNEPNRGDIVMLHSAGGLVVGEKNIINELAEKINELLWARRNSRVFLGILMAIEDHLRTTLEKNPLPTPWEFTQTRDKSVNAKLVRGDMYAVRSVPLRALKELISDPEKGSTLLETILRESVEEIEQGVGDVDRNPQSALSDKDFRPPELHDLVNAFKNSKLLEVLQEQKISEDQHFLVGIEPATFKDAYEYRCHPNRDPPPKYKLSVFHGKCSRNKDRFSPQETALDTVRETLWPCALREIAEESNLDKEIVARFEKRNPVIARFPQRQQEQGGASIGAAMFVLPIDNTTAHDLLESLERDCGAAHNELAVQWSSSCESRIRALTYGPIAN